MSLGQGFACYAQNGGFDFDYCDVIASKANTFYKHGELDLQAFIAIAMLVLGTKHNRWYVERKFIQMAGTSISAVLANRIRVEVELNNINFCRLIRQLEHSISVGRHELHPALQESLVDCPE